MSNCLSMRWLPMAFFYLQACSGYYCRRPLGALFLHQVNRTGASQKGFEVLAQTKRETNGYRRRRHGAARWED